MPWMLIPHSRAISAPPASWSVAASAAPCARLVIQVAANTAKATNAIPRTEETSLVLMVMGGSTVKRRRLRIDVSSAPGSCEPTQAHERQDETHGIRTDRPDGIHNNQQNKITQQQLKPEEHIRQAGRPTDLRRRSRTHNHNRICRVAPMQRPFPASASHFNKTRTPCVNAFATSPRTFF